MPVSKTKLLPYWSAPGATLYLGDVRECLRQLPARSVQCCVTSPPYWGLRDYGTGQWEGGNADCDHRGPPLASQKNTLGGGKGQHGDHFKVQQFTVPWKDGYCGKCGAKRIDMQIGSEPLPDCGTYGQAQCGACFVCSMVGVFSEVRRVLRDDGVLWLNLGDTYGGNSGERNGQSGSTLESAKQTAIRSTFTQSKRPVNTTLPAGNLVGIPWRVALALQADGWILRSDLPWVKRNAMPESVENRPCKSLEYVFLLAKNEAYYFDIDAIRQGATGTGGGSVFGRKSDPTGSTAAGAQVVREYDRPEYTSRAFRNSDLWYQSISTPHNTVGTGDELVGLDVTAKGYSGAHFAVFPPELIIPLVLAGTSEYGRCAVCAKPYERIVTRNKAVKQQGESEFERDRSFRWSRNGTDSTLDSGIAQRETVGWQKMCGCQTTEVVPCIVLDPFIGSGTTVATAIQLGRAGIGIDLSETYLRENAVPRIEAAMRGEKLSRKPTVAVLPDVPPPPEYFGR